MNLIFTMFDHLQKTISLLAGIFTVCEVMVAWVAGIASVLNVIAATMLAVTNWTTDTDSGLSAVNVCTNGVA